MAARSAALKAVLMADCSAVKKDLHWADQKDGQTAGPKVACSAASLVDRSAVCSAGLWAVQLDLVLV